MTFHRNHIQKNSNAYFLEQDNTVWIVTTKHLSTKTYSVTEHHYTQQSYNVQTFILFTSSSLALSIHWALHQISASRLKHTTDVTEEVFFMDQVMHIPSHSRCSEPSLHINATQKRLSQYWYEFNLNNTTYYIYPSHLMCQN